MFKKNSKHAQLDIFGIEMQPSAQKKLEASIWKIIRKQLFEQVTESNFSVLYSQKMGRPNAAINMLVTLLAIKEMFDWSFRELENQMEWHLGVQYASGMDLGGSGTTLRTITNFLRYLSDYYDQTGIDLFGIEFKRLVTDQINVFNVSTKIARTDSTHIDTNIVKYNRLQLLIEVVKRVYRILDPQDKQQMASLFSDYVNYAADHYVYHLRSSQIQGEFEKIGSCYAQLISLFVDKYAGIEEWELFLRVYEEQFKPGKDVDQPEIKPPREMTSDSVRGVDDPEATLRFKSGQHYLGYVAQLLETADPENELNLICDASIYPNNASDEQMLVDSFDELKTNTLPDLEELHFDGGYGGQILDEKLDKHSVKGIQTGIRGVKPTHRMDVVLQDGNYMLSCPEGHSVILQPARSGYKAEFSTDLCSNCTNRVGCPVRYIKKTNSYVYYIRECDLGKRIRLTNIKKIPEARRTIRSGVEATVRQFKCHTKAGKSRLRGRYRHQLWFTLLAMAINLKRIYNYATRVPDNRGNGSNARLTLRFVDLFTAILSEILSHMSCLSKTRSLAISMAQS